LYYPRRSFLLFRFRNVDGELYHISRDLSTPSSDGVEVLELKAEIPLNLPLTRETCCFVEELYLNDQGPRLNVVTGFDKLGTALLDVDSRRKGLRFSW